MPNYFLRNILCRNPGTLLSLLLAPLALSLVLLGSTGCGQTGALYLPADAGQETTAAVPTTTQAAPEQREPHRRPQPASAK
ncbi:MAG: hypothetical protein KJO24_00960 [Gammaproteobacteria bacterium]|nr:hypothetical protein [Gammaproteobacteria bacterium]